ncbi:hypothetical protein ACWDUL_05880 [Nocardia niigatensis]|uniref:hypothetical protein n=1 Tax=Nocardia niigatensis TaxID=209249 RepID=UPI0002E880EC|nr:hypothetical protein [Nocardia niigatensis]
MSDAARQLSHTLRAPLPAAFDQLDDTDLAELEHHLQATMTRRREALDAAIGSSLDFVPRLMRPAIKKALGL